MVTAHQVPTTPETERLLARVDRNSSVLEAIETLVERRLDEHRWDSAVAWARVGATFAGPNPTTTFRSTRIERALDEISRRLLPPLRSAMVDRDGSSKRSVLHVFSEGPATGGHFRYAMRWVTLDRERRSSVAVTRPGSDVPEMHSLALRHGGETAVLDGSLLDRAARLRSLAARFDTVICHTHYDDPVPSLAFGGAYAGPPVVLVNHADHVFGLGAGNLSALVDPRRTGADFAIRARGFPERISYLLPIPMTEVRRQFSREDAKARLGISPEKVVALTLARESKYQPSPTQPGFVDVVAPVFAEGDAVLVAVGPRHDRTPWRELGAELGNRLRVEGMRPEPEVYLDAADLYLDSLPFASTTSMLEAGSRGTPILSYRPHRGFDRLHSSEGILDDVVIAPQSIGEYRALLRRLLSDDTYRTSVGQLTEASVRATHGETAWKSAVEGLYAHAAETEPMIDRTSAPLTAEGEIREYAAALAGIEANTPLLWIVAGAMTGPRWALADRRDRSIGIVRLTAARVLSKARGGVSGSDAASLLIPGVRRALSRT
jgi:hypothetical protein